MHTIRKADRSDARTLSEIAERTFRDTFSAMNDAEDVDRYCRATYSESIQAAEISNPHMVTLLSEADGNIAGFAQLRWGDAPSCVLAESPGEIQRFYVVDAWQGKGIARRLMKSSIEEMKRHGSDVVWLGVWENNSRAIAFYRKCGFAEVGDHVFVLGSDPQRDIVMAATVRTLNA